MICLCQNVLMAVSIPLVASQRTPSAVSCFSLTARSERQSVRVLTYLHNLTPVNACVYFFSYYPTSCITQWKCFYDFPPLEVGAGTTENARNRISPICMSRAEHRASPVWS